MLHRTLSSAAVALLASVPLLAAAPAQAAPGQSFPCAAGVQKISSPESTAISVFLLCGASRVVDVRITADGAEIANFQQAVQAGVQQTVTVASPRVEQACATLQSGGETTTLCTP
ncbi:hypothetical protein [Streptomyces sp. NPDC087512]|uniref:hypothetical protein n=1 Tax=unclassified Streptomyces TaxID=2593676 RepID=UPI003422C4CB